MTTDPAEAELRALDLFERLLGFPGNARFRARLLKGAPADVLDRLARIEAGHAARAAMPTGLPDGGVPRNWDVPTRIGVFHLTERIGQGGMGDVWKAQRDDGLFNQTVAIKLIHAHMPESAKAAFETERQILAQLDHPAIVRLLDGGVTGTDIPYLVMDYVDGRPLDEAIAPLTIRDRITLFLQTLGAVEYAHSRLIAHADLKPANLIVDQSGRVRLLDFGISGLMTGGNSYTPPPGAMTRAFSSPERVAGGLPSVADDVFALGRIMAGLLDDPPSPELDAISAKASAHAPGERYPSVAAMADDLRAWLDKRPVTAFSTTAGYRARKFVARHRVGVITSMLGVCALLGMTGYATYNSIRAERAKTEAAARFEDARGTARYLLFTLMDRLEAQPNTLALRGEVANVAQHYLDRLSHATDAGDDVRAEAANGLIRLAEAQGVPGSLNLAQPAKAKRSLDRALSLLGPEPDGPMAQLAIRAMIDQARLSSSVDHDAQAAMAWITRTEKLISLHPDTPAMITARVRNEKGAALGWMNDYVGSARLAKQTLADLPVSRDRETLIERARAHDLLADGTYYSVGPQAAVPSYEAALAAYEDAYRRYPTARLIRERMERARWALGSTLLSIDRNAEALAIFTTGADHLEDMVRFDADDGEAVRLLQMVGLDQAQSVADIGRFEEAIRLYGENIAQRRSWLAKRPTEQRRLRDLAIAIKSLGDVEARAGLINRACGHYGEFRGLIAQLGRRGKLDGMDLEYTLDHLVQDEARYCPKAAQPQIP